MLKIKGGKMKPYFQEEFFLPSFPCQDGDTLDVFSIPFCAFIKPSKKKKGSPLIASGTEHHSLICNEALRAEIPSELSFSKKNI